MDNIVLFFMIIFSILFGYKLGKGEEPTEFIEKAIHKIKPNKKEDIEDSNEKTLLDNIMSYDGTETSQKDFK